MPPRNPLGQDSRPLEEAKAEEIINTRTQRSVRLIAPDGGAQEILMDIKDSIPDENGNWVDTELVNVVTDRAGNTLPDDPRSVTLSHSGLYITSPEQRAECTSWLHPPGRSRTIFIGQDGRLTANGAICSRCDFWLGTLYLIIGILAIGFIVGVWQGAGLF